MVEVYREVAVEVYREVAEKGGYIYIDLVDGKSEAYSPSRLARVIAKEYNVDSEAILDSPYVSEFLKKYRLSRRANTPIVERISKDHKTADELKREIKRVTRDFERFINVLIDRAKELREQQNLEGWLWTRARYDTEKRRFVKCD